MTNLFIAIIKALAVGSLIFAAIFISIFIGLIGQEIVKDLRRKKPPRKNKGG